MVVDGRCDKKKNEDLGRKIKTEKEKERKIALKTGKRP